MKKIILSGFIAILAACGRTDPSAETNVKNAVWNVYCDSQRFSVVTILTRMHVQSDAEFDKMKANVSNEEGKFPYDLARETYKHRNAWENIEAPIKHVYKDKDLGACRT
jgi:hypothetical protein